MEAGVPSAEGGDQLPGRGPIRGLDLCSRPGVPGWLHASTGLLSSGCDRPSLPLSLSLHWSHTTKHKQGVLLGDSQRVVIWKDSQVKAHRG